MVFRGEALSIQRLIQRCVEDATLWAERMSQISVFCLLSPHCKSLIKLNTMYLPLLSIYTKISGGEAPPEKKQGKWDLEHRKGERDRLSQSVSLMP
ncbi:hypothetical protein DAI22_12g160800 [Oryza sativa Japonica Group]|nr:hypothetical protein DAI22_12g160800 [Oryza sativa Japonica Group]